MKPLDKIAKVTEISKDEIKIIIKEVRANHKSLDSCSFHIFEPVDNSVNPKFRCKNCKGMVGIT